MKPVSVIASRFFLCIMLLSIVKNPLLYTIYKYDTDLFIAMFCENKDRPEMKCNGQCFLAKMQKEQDRKDADNRLKQLQAEGVYCYFATPLHIVGTSFDVTENSEQTVYYNRLYSYLFIFHSNKPPESAVLC